MPVRSLGVSVQIRECLQASDSLPGEEDEDDEEDDEDEEEEEEEDEEDEEASLRMRECLQKKGGNDVKH